MNGVKERIKDALKRAAVKRPRLADIFYSFDGSFRDEHHAVVTGMERHRRDLETRTGIGGVSDFRRRIHRLEKGLVSQPRRDVFALDYIRETVEARALLIANGAVGSQDPLANWSYGVLRRYFETVASHEVVDGARRLFEETTQGAKAALNGRTAPFVRTDDPGVSYDELLTLARRRRSVRSYQDRTVPRELIEKAVAVAAEAPTACNRQPYQFLVYDEKELVEQIGMIPAGARTFIKGAPCVIVVVGNTSAFAAAGDRHVIYVDAALAVMALELALETLGLSSCSINWRELAHLNAQIGRAIGLEPYERVVMLVSVGYADWGVEVPGSCKKAPAELCVYNRRPGGSA